MRTCVFYREAKKTNKGKTIVYAAVEQSRVQSIRLNGFGTDSLLEVCPCSFVADRYML